MHELQKQTIEVVNNINQEWVNAIKDAEKNKSAIDITSIMGKFSQNVAKLLQHFRDAEERLRNPKKTGGFFK